ncbi:MAG: hypothetical protein Ct9H300mP1_29200 [Planctomycetaceae bacterium]|nr:MAG: hypothetical protein Ct9H300mP1_29200 [Planctomycetaceae bacterium]
MLIRPCGIRFGHSTKPSTSKPPKPFRTSTMLRAAQTFLGFNAGRTSPAAQGLYQGDALASSDIGGLITYMRTDSTHLAPEAIEAARGKIESKWGAEYRPDSPRIYETDRSDAQEAHEAIRPHRCKPHARESQGKTRRGSVATVRVDLEAFLLHAR